MNFKRFTSILLASTMIATSLPMLTFAAEEAPSTTTTISTNTGLVQRFMYNISVDVGIFTQYSNW